MKPENALLDAQGHLRLSDFGLSRQLTEKENYQTRGRAGTFGYLAPEALANKDHGFESDVWSFGVVVFEMLHGKMPWDRHGPILSMVKSTDANHHIPFGDEDIKTIVGSIHVSKKLSSDARDLLKGLLRLDSKNRLGCSPTGRGWAEVKEHAWFRNTDWKAMKARSLSPPIKPKDEKNATPDAAIADAFEDEEPKPITSEQQRLFDNWEYNVSLTAGARIAPTTKSSSPSPPTPQPHLRVLQGTDPPPPLTPPQIPANLPPLAGGGNAALHTQATAAAAALLTPASPAKGNKHNKA
jgi:serine/threonine protein kinase